MINFLQHLDIAFFCLINGHHGPIFDVFFFLITWLGNGWVITPILLAIAWMKVPRKRLWAFILIAAAGMIGSGLINSEIKGLTHRSRPIIYFSEKSAGADASPPARFTVHVVGEPLSYRAFPSGHSNTALGAATLVALCFGGWYWIAFIPALLVGYSRIYIGAHFPFDVVVGGMLGIALMTITGFIVRGAVLTRPHLPRSNNDPQ